MRANNRIGYKSPNDAIYETEMDSRGKLTKKNLFNKLNRKNLLKVVDLLCALRELKNLNSLAIEMGNEIENVHNRIELMIEFIILFYLSELAFQSASFDAIQLFCKQKVKLIH